MPNTLTMRNAANPTTDGFRSDIRSSLGLFVWHADGTALTPRRIALRRLHDRAPGCTSSPPSPHLPRPRVASFAARVARDVTFDRRHAKTSLTTQGDRHERDQDQFES